MPGRATFPARKFSCLLALTCLSATASAQPLIGPVIYGGGRVLTSPQITVVFWGDSVLPNVQASAPALYQTLVRLDDFDWIAEYDTPTQHIGRGSFLGQYFITPFDQRTQLKDVDIQAELVAQVDAGFLPPTNENSYYALYLPAGIVVRAGFWEDKSCEMWSAYHGDFGTELPGTYALFPCCDRTCARGLSPNGLHELFEATTDPHSDGWQSAGGWEIADLCGSRPDILLPDGGALLIQGLWSNHQNGCEGSSHEFTVALDRPTVTASGPEATFQVSLAGPGATAGPISLSLINLPPGVSSTIAPGTAPGSPQTLTLHLEAKTPPFSFTMEARSAAWQSVTYGTVLRTPAAAEVSTGCTSVDGPPWHLAAVAVLVALGWRHAGGSPSASSRRGAPRAGKQAPFTGSPE